MPSKGEEEGKRDTWVPEKVAFDARFWWIWLNFFSVTGVAWNACG